MLHEFVTANRLEIIARCRARILSRPAPRPTDVELEFGVPLFLDQLADTLRQALDANPEMGRSAAKHGSELLHSGFTIAQVVHDYGGVCQAVTELAAEMSATITASEFQVMNRSLDSAIANAVTEYTRLREHEGTERLGRLAHELRNLLNSASLAFDVLKTGTVGISGSTGAVLARSLAGLRSVIDRELADVRLSAGVLHLEMVDLADFIEGIEVAASMEANSRHLQFSAIPVGRGITVHADRQILESMVWNLVHNALKFTHAGGGVVLRAHATAGRVFIAVDDQCGGLPPGKADELFTPFEQRSTDRTGIGLGLGICHRGAHVNGGVIHVVDRPGIGCTFTIDLPRSPAQPME